MFSAGENCEGGGVMATFIAIKNKKQTAGTMRGVLKYVVQDYKTR